MRCAVNFACMCLLLSACTLGRQTVQDSAAVAAVRTEAVQHRDSSLLQLASAVELTLDSAEIVSVNDSVSIRARRIRLRTRRSAQLSEGRETLRQVHDTVVITKQLISEPTRPRTYSPWPWLLTGVAVGVAAFLAVRQVFG